ncbi:acyl-CoA dehydrogenase family protein [Psychromarinibacter sp. C21-152]|uniref:Acyl-CoA dehydrogenase family protein n=1 Tax=Psychromarinibacter sediminicola TaxID=3033385 RepID=A0AAE3NP96_9RHOB|nr:acyl-CoA dehydrogenase family protein [Psychromarinibacter sediminicola]MDF0599606.1 acyl-CoA dehydrogenase family protein [Psychromarinibacter sediminicola]
MRFEPNEDQATFLSVLDQMAEDAGAAWEVPADWSRFQWAAGLDRTLEENGFFDCAAEESLGPVAAAAMVHRLARLPVTLEVAASALLRPFLPKGLPRPVAVIDDSPAAPIRFLPVAASVLSLSGDAVRVAVLAEGDVRPVDSLFAYPMGVFARTIGDWQRLDADPNAVREAWRVALAAELGGTLRGGQDAVLAHVRERRQFGQPLGSFQGVQHRLAGAGTKIEAAYWMTLRAAQGVDPADSAVALGYVQNAATAAVYDLHQFMGAMGLTLEHPLHRWTYRARLLKSALGGPSGNFGLVARRKWRAA